ncbi:hypothetical protein AVEN_85357-1 [Araneus ventricosus]|uniref:Uncharacterized protein n=1 Tax=Araneus ventricosus TaxID=182803 RepID=A0A4Y2DYY0_ARAVE|nr:hypothetical protein AVEN_85357-1 [Araneus ventricosus]
MEIEESKETDKDPEKSREQELLELAKKELLREIKCASLRAEQFGAHSWAKPQHYVPSKRFLKHMLVSASRDNDRREQHTIERREKAIKHNTNSFRRYSSYSRDERKTKDSHMENEMENYRRKKHKHKEKKASKDKKKDKSYSKSVKKRHSSER